MRSNKNAVVTVYIKAGKKLYQNRTLVVSIANSDPLL